MTPTPYAVSVRAHVHQLVQQAQELLAPNRELDLGTLERTFTLRWHDTLVGAYGPALLAAVRAAAPGVRLRFVAESSTDTPELRRGEVDLESGADRPSAPEIRSEQVGEDRLAVAVRPGHPLLRGARTAARYAAAEHLTVSRRGRLSDPVDEALAGLGLARRVVASAPTGTAALQFVRGSDLVVTVPELVARGAVADLGLRLLPLPLELPPIPLYLCWHQRYQDDRAHAWLRGLALAALRTAPAAVGDALA
jgi:DNA-binding transcriptional LysR family regulator